MTVAGGVLRLLTPTEVADQLGVPVKTIFVWRTKGKGPTGLRVGKHLRFRQSSVDAWVLEQENEQVSS